VDESTRGTMHSRIVSSGNGIIDSFLHGSVRGNELIAVRHRTFVVSHLAGAAMAAAAIPVHWIVNGALDPLVLGILCWLITPIFVAVFLAYTGALATAHLLSTAILAVLVGAVAAHTGGVASFAVFWLLAVPVEAAMSGSRRVVVASIFVSLAILTGLVMAGEFHWLPVSRVNAADAQFYGTIGLVSAFLYTAMLAATIEHLSGKTDQAVQDHAQRYRLLAENATDMITRHGPNGDVAFVSGAASSLVECDAQKLMGTGYLNLVHPEDRHIYVTTFVTAADTGRPATAEFRLTGAFSGADGRSAYKWVELNCRPIPSAGCQHGATELVAVSRDVTLRKHDQDNLRLARDAAEQANHAKTAFLANMSHELRTPLNSIIGFAELLEREPPTEVKVAAHQEYAALIHQSGAHLLGLLNDLLDLSKIEAGQMKLWPESVDLNEIVSYCRQSMSASETVTGVSVVLQLAEGGVVLEADLRACKQIVLNLLSNAVKFSAADGSVHITTNSDDTMAHVSVMDQGSGIPPGVLEKLGQPFVQADGAYSRSHKGAGLGLSIVYGLVRLHGGEIDIDSARGRGTCVTVSLPLRQTNSIETVMARKTENSGSRSLEPVV